MLAPVHARDDPYGSPERSDPFEGREYRCQAVDGASIDRVDDELHVVDALGGVGPQLVGDVLRRSLQGRQGWGVGARQPTAATGHPDLDADRPLDGGRIPPDVATDIVDDRPQRRARRPGALPVSVYQTFQASTCGRVIASIRGPFEPIISGGPSGRGPRGRSSQSRAW